MDRLGGPRDISSGIQTLNLIDYGDEPPPNYDNYEMFAHDLESYCNKKHNISTWTTCGYEKAFPLRPQQFLWKDACITIY